MNVQVLKISQPPPETPCGLLGGARGSPQILQGRSQDTQHMASGMPYQSATHTQQQTEPAWVLQCTVTWCAFFLNFCLKKQQQHKLTPTNALNNFSNC